MPKQGEKSVPHNTIQSFITSPPSCLSGLVHLNKLLLGPSIHPFAFQAAPTCLLDKKVWKGRKSTFGLKVGGRRGGRSMSWLITWHLQLWRKEDRRGARLRNLKAGSSDQLLPTELIFKAFPAAEDQVFRPVSPWRTFPIQTTLLPSIMKLIHEDTVYWVHSTP